VRGVSRRQDRGRPLSKALSPELIIAASGGLAAAVALVLAAYSLRLTGETRRRLQELHRQLIAFEDRVTGYQRYLR
jgi:hypothetical protein